MAVAKTEYARSRQNLSLTSQNQINMQPCHLNFTLQNNKTEPLIHHRDLKVILADLQTSKKAQIPKRMHNN